MSTLASTPLQSKQDDCNRDRGIHSCGACSALGQSQQSSPHYNARIMQTYTVTGTFTLQVSAGEVNIVGITESALVAVPTYPEWVKPEYKAGSVVRYFGLLYIAKRDNAYVPTSTSYWTRYTPPTT